MIEGVKRNKCFGAFISFPTPYMNKTIGGVKRNKCTEAFISFNTLYHFLIPTETGTTHDTERTAAQLAHDIHDESAPVSIAPVVKDRAAASHKSARTIGSNGRPVGSRYRT
jgi:hypothetical protein